MIRITCLPVIIVAGILANGCDKPQKNSSVPAQTTSESPDKGGAVTEDVARTLRSLYRHVKAYHLEKAMLPPSTSPTPALGACCDPAGNRRCTPNPALWNIPEWRAIGFSVDETHAYSYLFQKKGTDFVIRAVGDLDCDGEFGTFWIEGRIDAATGQVVSDLEIKTENPHE